MNLQLAILDALRLANPNLMPEPALVSQVRLAGATGKSVTLTELRVELFALEQRGEAVGVSNEDTGTRWRISDPGLARLANANL